MKRRFDISVRKGVPGRARDWMKAHRLPPRLLFVLMGIISTVWFLVRVIPKPSRAAYPCMRVAAPIMSGFVVYLLSLGGSALVLRKARDLFLRSRYIISVILVLIAFTGLWISNSVHAPDSLAGGLEKTGPDDGPNQPMGEGKGVNPGRVVWVWDPEATNEHCINAYDLHKPGNTDQGVVNRMVADGIAKLGGSSSLYDSWDAIFRYFNSQKSGSSKGYTRGEKIFIKINQGTANGKLWRRDIQNGFYIPAELTESEEARRGYSGTCEAYPNVVLEILHELVHVVGIDQKDIAIGDPISHIFGHNYDAWAGEFPDVVYVDRAYAIHGRTLIHPTEDDLVFYSDQTQADKLYDIIEQADYLINVANLKPHGRAGVSLTAKNHFGSHARRGAYNLHYSLISPVSMGKPTNSGYRKYRAQVDLMGSRYLGRNTLLYVVDGLYGGGSVETKVPVKYFMPPFHNDWCNSIFISQDQVALESVCYDFLRTEWNGTYQHSAANNTFESIPNVNGVDDYLHQAADNANWPDGIIYDPDHSGQPLPSLGVHEHWNDAARKQYSRNLGTGEGIELISIPDSLVGSEGLLLFIQQYSGEKPGELKPGEMQPVAAAVPISALKDGSKPVIVDRSFNGAFQARDFYAATVDQENTVWFLTEAGIVSFDHENWKVHRSNTKVPTRNMNDFAYEFSAYGDLLWIATTPGAAVVSLPIDARSGATTYHSGNSGIVGDTVVSVAAGNGSLRWFGTPDGISAFSDSGWLSRSYQERYPEGLFRMFPITDLASTPDGDSLYIATEGAGIARVYRDDVDAISGASEYIRWGPIEIPSDNIYCICITPDGTQWFGTDAGAARHTGYRTLENWTVFTAENGLVDNFVQAIAADNQGNIWFGTRGGITVYDGAAMTSFTTQDGLTGNNVRSIVVDNEGVVWIGTSAGVTSYHAGQFTRYSE
jgi:hypothetical protein